MQRAKHTNTHMKTQTYNFGGIKIFENILTDFFTDGVSHLFP